MLDTKTILVKELKLCNWSVSFSLALKQLYPLLPTKNIFPKLAPSLEKYLLEQKALSTKTFFIELAKFEKNFECYWDYRFGLGYFQAYADSIYGYWFLHVRFFIALSGAAWMSHDAYAIPEVTAYFKNDSIIKENLLEKEDAKILYDLFQKVMVYWFSFPTLINDFYKQALEQNFAPELELILLQYWAQLPEVINQLYHLLICYSPNKLLMRYIPEESKWKFFNKFVDDTSVKDEPSFHRFTWFSHLDDEANFYPQTKNVLKVFKQKGEILPRNFDELLALYKEGLQPWSSDFEYFFKFLEENKHLIRIFAISEVTWKLLVYNPPFPMSLAKAMYPQTREDYMVTPDACE